MAEALYSLPRDQFTAARNAAAARAREQGQRELAEQIGALRRPSTAAWLANMLVREQPDEIRAIAQLGDGLREAQQLLQGDELRRLSQQRHELVHGLVQQAQALARTAGHPASEAVIRELANTFTAAVNSSAAAHALAGGRLTSALDPGDAAAEVFARAGAGTGAVGDWGRDPEDTARGSEQLRHDLERFRIQAADAAATCDEARRALTDAHRRAQDAATALQELHARLEAAEQTEHEARRRAQSALRDFDSADRAAREAQQRVHDVERRLAELGSR